MTNENAILAAKTISEFLNGINQRYKLALPTDFLDDNPLSQLFRGSITVEEGKTNGILYEARGDPPDYPPFNFGNNLRENYKFTLKVIIYS